MTKVFTLRTTRPNWYPGKIDLRSRRTWYDSDTDDTGNHESDSNGGSSEGRSFSQADVDRIVQQRLERARTDASAVEASLLQQLGVADLTSAQTLIKSARDAEAANQTELEQVQTALQAAQEQITQFQSEAETARTTLIQERRNTALHNALSTANAVSVRPAMLAILDSGATLVNDKGEVDADAVKAAVDKLKTDEPALFTPQSRGLDSIRDRNNVTPDADRAKRAAEQMDRTIRHQR